MDCDTPDMYKDTYQSFINLIVKCKLRKDPKCDRNCELEANMETYTTLKLIEHDETYEKEMNDPVFANTENEITGIIRMDPYICGKEIIDTFSWNPNVGCREGNELCSFRLLWLSTLAGLKDCDSDCIVNTMDTSDTKFIIRKMKDLVIDIEKVKADNSCFQSNPACLEAVKDIISDEFTSNDYNKQLNQLRIAVDGMTGELNNEFSEWVQINPDNKECIDDIKKCLGKM